MDGMYQLETRWKRTRVLGGPIALMIALATPVPEAAAQAGGQVTAQQRQGAAEAYDRGTSAFLSGDYAQAAQWFEAANRLAPAAPALLQAIRAHRQAGNLLRAATLSLQMVAEYPDNAANRYADEILQEAVGQFFRVNVVCDGCRVDLDGGLVSHTSFFLEADTSHKVTALFDTGNVEQEVQGEAGESVDLAFEAPPPPPPGEEPTTPGAAPAEEEWEGLPPWAFYTAAGLTIASAGVLGYFIYDMNSGVSAYEDAANQCTNTGMNCDLAQQLLADGQDRELRTNVFIGLTAGFGALAVTAAVLTNWAGSSDEEAPTADEEGVDDVQTSFGVTPDGGGVVVRGRF